MVDVANIHLPVLLDDCVNLMAPALEHENAIAVDCTSGPCRPFHRLPQGRASGSAHRH